MAFDILLLWKDDVPKWQPSIYISSEDDTPLMPKYESYESRLSTYNCQEFLKDLDRSKIEWLAKLGYYFCPLAGNNGGMVICFCCGSYSQTFRYNLEMSNYDDGERHIFAFIHHYHCPFINDLVKKGDELVINSKEDPAEEMKRIQRKYIVRESIMKTRQEAKKRLSPASNFLLDSPSVCVICKTAPKEICFFPCQNNGCCIKCAKKDSKCPECQQPYLGLTRCYLDDDKHVRPEFRLDEKSKI